MNLRLILHRPRHYIHQKSLLSSYPRCSYHQFDNFLLDETHHRNRYLISALNHIVTDFFDIHYSGYFSDHISTDFDFLNHNEIGFLNGFL